jgi:hypothetical protein
MPPPPPPLQPTLNNAPSRLGLRKPSLTSESGKENNNPFAKLAPGIAATSTAITNIANKENDMKMFNYNYHARRPLSAVEGSENVIPAAGNSGIEVSPMKRARLTGGPLRVPKTSTASITNTNVQIDLDALMRPKFNR